MNRFRNRHLSPLISAAIGAAIAACWMLAAESATHAIGTCADDYRRCLAAWKAGRLASLKSDDGYLNLAGLFWLHDGVNTFGSGAANDLVFPSAAMVEMGAFELDEHGVEMIVLSRANVRMNGNPVKRVRMADDTSAHPDIATFGSFSWAVIRRSNRFAVRLRDFASPVLNAFPPIEYFPVDEKLRVEARLARYDRPRIMRVDTVIEGLDYNPSSPGLLKFEIGGQAFELEAYDAGDELLLVFGDATTGRETYPAGRFLYTRKPGKDGVVVLDFNTAQNPPCAFNEFATCPIASPRNRLAVRIPAGERFDPSGH